MGALITQFALDAKTNATFPTLWYDDGSGILKQVVEDTTQLPSGLSPVTGQFTGVANSLPFSPIPGRGFNVSVLQNFSGVISVTRSFDAGANYLLTGNDFVSGPVSAILQEPESGVLYRFECTLLSSGTPNYRLSQ